MNSRQDESTRVVGMATVFLRPLRYIFDIETDVAVVCEDESSSVLPFESVHVHVRAATRPPLMERKELLNGFLRAETSIYRSALSTHRQPYGLDDCEMDSDSKERFVESEPVEEDRTLSSLRGTYVWLLIRLQPLDMNTNKPLLLSEAEDRNRAVRVQYQISPASESFCLPVDHTNVVKVLVTDELIHRVDSGMLQFNFLSVMLDALKSTETKPEATTAITHACNEAALAASEAVVAEEVRRRKQVEIELAEARAAAQAKDQERFDAQQQSKQDAQYAQALVIARNEQAHARSLLEQELAIRAQQNDELKQARKQLEDQLLATNENAQHFQINIGSTHQALEMLKQRADSDSKERSELQRRLRVLEEEKLALQSKSRACTLQ